MKRLFAVALGILTAIGGFLDIGDLVTNAVVGSRFGLALAWVVPVGVLGICLFAQMSGRVAAVSGRATFELIRERLGPRTAAANLAASFFINLMTLTAEIGGVALALQLATGVGPMMWIPGRGVRRLAGGLAGEVLDHGERHWHARAVPDRLRGQCLCAASELVGADASGRRAGDPGVGVGGHLLVFRDRPVRCGDDTL